MPQCDLIWSLTKAFGKSSGLANSLGLQSHSFIFTASPCLNGTLTAPPTFVHSKCHGCTRCTSQMYIHAYASTLLHIPLQFYCGAGCPLFHAHNFWPY